MSFTRRLRRANGTFHKHCKTCGAVLYFTDNPNPGSPQVFCNNACNGEGGKPLPPDMLATKRKVPAL